MDTHTPAKMIESGHRARTANPPTEPTGAGGADSGRQAQAERGWPRGGGVVAHKAGCSGSDPSHQGVRTTVSRHGVLPSTQARAWEASRRHARPRSGHVYIATPTRNANSERARHVRVDSIL